MNDKIEINFLLALSVEQIKALPIDTLPIKTVACLIEGINGLERDIAVRVKKGSTLVTALDGTVLDEANINARIKQLALTLSEDSTIKNPILVGVMDGAARFWVKLCAELDELGFQYEPMTILTASYDGMTSGALYIQDKLKIQPVLRDVILVDELSDTGKTAVKLKEFFNARSAHVVKLITLAAKTKPGKSAENKPDYDGAFEIDPNTWIVGYGLNYIGGFHRNLNSIRGVDLGTIANIKEDAVLGLKDELCKRYIELDQEQKLTKKAGHSTNPNIVFNVNVTKKGTDEVGLPQSLGLH